MKSWVLVITVIPDLAVLYSLPVIRACLGSASSFFYFYRFQLIYVCVEGPQEELSVELEEP